MNCDDIILRHAILHILDSTVGMPVLSDTLLNLNPELNDFLREHMFRILSSDDTKKCRFLEESVVKKRLEGFTEEELLSVSRDIATQLYQLMNQNIAIPPGDVFFLTYQLESRLFLAILKMNYKEYYVHYTETLEEGNVNDVVKQRAALPGSGKLSEAAFLDLSDYILLLTEKKYEINGEKQ